MLLPARLNSLVALLAAGATAALLVPPSPASAHQQATKVTARQVAALRLPANVMASRC
jgi:hypothetical protein